MNQVRNVAHGFLAMKPPQQLRKRHLALAYDSEVRGDCRHDLLRHHRKSYATQDQRNRPPALQRIDDSIDLRDEGMLAREVNVIGISERHSPKVDAIELRVSLDRCA